jgi:hypothetical protein
MHSELHQIDEIQLTEEMRLPSPRPNGPLRSHFLGNLSPPSLLVTCGTGIV